MMVTLSGRNPDQDRVLPAYESKPVVLHSRKDKLQGKTNRLA
jgi:hypothetical protein